MFDHIKYLYGLFGFLLFMSKVIYYQNLGRTLINGANVKLILPVINRTQIMCVTPIKEQISKTLIWYYGIRISYVFLFMIFCTLCHQ